MDLLVPVVLVLLGIGFVTHDEPCSQYRHFGCVVVIAAVCPSTSSRWIVAATAPGVAAVKVVVEAGTEFLL